MKIKGISSSKVKFLSGNIKDLINMGIWFLYEVHDSNFPDVAYLLVSAESCDLLSSEGKIIRSFSNYRESLQRGSRILFNDIPLLQDLFMLG